MNADWSVCIERLPIDLRVGIYPHEAEPQPVWVSLRVQGRASALPQQLGECLDYEPLLHWLTRIWPQTPHVPLLETRINELANFVFSADPRVQAVQLTLCKQRLAQGAVCVGLERHMDRAQWLALAHGPRRATAAAPTAWPQPRTPENTPHELAPH